MKNSDQTTAIAELEARIEALETTVAFQEDTIAELDRFGAEQLVQVQRLESAVEKLINQFRDMQGGESPANEKPPHY